MTFFSISNHLLQNGNKQVQCFSLREKKKWIEQKVNYPILVYKWVYSCQYINRSDENAIKATFCDGNELHAWAFLAMKLDHEPNAHNVSLSHCVNCIDSICFLFYVLCLSIDRLNIGKLNCFVMGQMYENTNKRLTFASTWWFQRPHLFFLETGSVRIEFVAKCFGCHVFVLAIDQTDGPPTLLLIMR